MTTCKKIALSFALTIIQYLSSYAGPPFYTDDPAPVDFKHWEYYISSINMRQNNFWSGTLPHFEVNYGVVPDVQIHLLLPFNYNYTHPVMNVGYASTEIGVKYRFVKETDNMPQIGVFPIAEVPTVQNASFGNGKVQLYLPMWIQKSWGKLTTYGGAGYWLNPGTGNKNWLFTGWEAQFDFSSWITLGGELYYHTAPDIESSPSAGYNAGGFINFSTKFHFIFSAGNNFTKNHYFSSYLGLLWTI